MSIGVKATFVQLVPAVAIGVPNGAVFLDSMNSNIPSIKTIGGQVEELTSSGANLYIKQMQAGGPIELNRPVSKRSDGRIVAADSDSVSGQQVVGYALQSALASGDIIKVLCVGANLAGAIAGLNFAPGEEVFLAEDGSGYARVTDLTGNDDSVIRVGIADCAAGPASTTATDLIVTTEVVLRP